MPESDTTTPEPVGPKPTIEYTLPNYVMTVFVSWLVPGSGFWFLGQRKRAIILGVAVLGLFWGGQVLADYRAVNRDIHEYFFIGQAGNGLSTLVSEYFIRRGRPTARSSHRVSRDLPELLSTGINFTTIAGLLNMLIVLHIADPKVWSGEFARRLAEQDEERRKTEEDGT